MINISPIVLNWNVIDSTFLPLLSNFSRYNNCVDFCQCKSIFFKYCIFLLLHPEIHPVYPRPLVWSHKSRIVGQIHIGHLPTISVYSAKVTIKMNGNIIKLFLQEFIVYIYSNSEWKKNKFLIFKVMKSWVVSKFTA